MEVTGAKCMLCDGEGQVGHFKAAAWESAQVHDTEREMKAVRDDPGDGGRKT